MCVRACVRACVRGVCVCMCVCFHQPSYVKMFCFVSTTICFDCFLLTSYFCALLLLFVSFFLCFCFVVVFLLRLVYC